MAKQSKPVQAHQYASHISIAGPMHACGRPLADMQSCMQPSPCLGLRACQGMQPPGCNAAVAELAAQSRLSRRLYNLEHMMEKHAAGGYQLAARRLLHAVMPSWGKGLSLPLTNALPPLPCPGPPSLSAHANPAQAPAAATTPCSSWRAPLWRHCHGCRLSMVSRSPLAARVSAAGRCACSDCTHHCGTVQPA